MKRHLLTQYVSKLSLLYHIYTGENSQGQERKQNLHHNLDNHKKRWIFNSNEGFL